MPRCQMTPRTKLSFKREISYIQSQYNETKERGGWVCSFLPKMLFFILFHWKWIEVEISLWYYSLVLPCILLWDQRRTQRKLNIQGQFNPVVYQHNRNITPWYKPNHKICSRAHSKMGRFNTMMLTTTTTLTTTIMIVTITMIIVTIMILYYNVITINYTILPSTITMTWS